MNAICLNQEIPILRSSFMQNTTCINPDYNLGDFDRPVDPVKVALIGFINLGLIGMFYIVS